MSPKCHVQDVPVMLQWKLKHFSFLCLSLLAINVMMFVFIYLFLLLQEHDIYFTTCLFPNAHRDIDYCFGNTVYSLLDANSC